ncbi:hypothetical protein [Pseudaestuariivita sp.]|uniref:hypothetical protein n=1 Tax=Pseudaestuariivita sp. TaxID=2211669 RepID=UPI004058449F
MQVLGRDMNLNAYRVQCDAAGVTGFVPESLMTDTMVGFPSHGAAYDWIAAHQPQITQALTARAANRTPRPPYDRITLAED